MGCDLDSAETEATTPVTAEDLFRLGLKYSTGLPGETDYVMAHQWFNLAALLGSEPAKDYRREIAAEMSAEEIAAAQRGARQWLMRQRGEAGGPAAPAPTERAPERVPETVLQTAPETGPVRPAAQAA